ncbi:MAG: hypothetical protein SO071_07545 [Prevotella sp.]|nr:hypothetical protein [Prevotella sp.]MDY3965052.1 hypothetical protein [Prevotella sp.]MDY4991004.1 hypothetical protein [Prevotella sp.]
MSKKIYITPELEFLANETMLMQNSWNVDKVDDEANWEENHPNDWGNIFFDKGQGNNGDYDPWDSDNW